MALLHHWNTQTICGLPSSLAGRNCGATYCGWVGVLLYCFCWLVTVGVTCWCVVVTHATLLFVLGCTGTSYHGNVGSFGARGVFWLIGWCGNMVWEAETGGQVEESGEHCNVDSTIFKGDGLRRVWPVVGSRKRQARSHWNSAAGCFCVELVFCVSCPSGQMFGTRRINGCLLDGYSAAGWVGED